MVDDDPKILRLIRTYLEREGFRVIEATDGRAALAAIAIDEPALIVLDRMIPHVDGLTVLRAVRRWSRVPVVVLSARGTTPDRIEGLASGADDYVPSPSRRPKSSSCGSGASWSEPQGQAPTRAASQRGRLIVREGHLPRAPSFATAASSSTATATRHRSTARPSR